MWALSFSRHSSLFSRFSIFLQDYHSPFYIAPRMGRGEKPFRMVKFRSMVIRADKSGVDSTAGDDPRITSLGRFIRRFKLDEIPQLWNVLLGQMSLVGPRPNVERETILYTNDEKRLLSVRPGSLISLRSYSLTRAKSSKAAPTPTSATIRSFVRGSPASDCSTPMRKPSVATRSESDSADGEGRSRPVAALEVFIASL